MIHPLASRQRRVRWSGPSAQGLKILAWDLYWKATQWGSKPPSGPRILLPPLTTSTRPLSRDLQCLMHTKHSSEPLLNLPPCQDYPFLHSFYEPFFLIAQVSTQMSSVLWSFPCPSIWPAKSNSWIVKGKKRPEISGEILHEPSLSPFLIMAPLICFHRSLYFLHTALSILYCNCLFIYL